MFLQLDVVSERWHSPHNRVYNILDYIVRVVGHFVLSDAVMQHATFILCSSLHIRLQKGLHYYFGVLIITNQ